MGPSLTWNSFGYHVNLNGTNGLIPLHGQFTSTSLVLECERGKYNANVLPARPPHSRITHLTKKQDFEYTPP